MIGVPSREPRYHSVSAPEGDAGRTPFLERPAWEAMMGFISTLFLVIVSVGAAQATDPATTDLVKKMGDYVAGYGEQTSAIIGT